MEGNHSQSPTGVQAGHCPLHHPLHTAQLVVDGNADGLKASLGRVLLLPQGSRRHGSPDNIHQFQSGFDGGFLSALADGRRDPGGVAFLAVIVENPL